MGLDLILSPLLEWFPVYPARGGRLASLAGFLLKPRRCLSILKSWVGLSSILTSAFLGLFLSRISGISTSLGGATQLLLSIAGTVMALLIRSGTSTIQDRRRFKTWDGAVAGTIQGLSVVGFGGSGASCAILMASGLDFKDAVVLSSVAALPVVFVGFESTLMILAPFLALPVLFVLERGLQRVEIAPSTASLFMLLPWLPNGIASANALFKEGSLGRLLMVATELLKYGEGGLLLGMIFQSIISIIPADPLLMAAGAFGMEGWRITIFGGIGMALGALANFYISRMAGRPIVERLFRSETIKRVDSWLMNWGVWAVVVARLIPFTPVDVVSYVAGLSMMSPIAFFLVNLVALLPRAAFFGFLGSLISRNKWIAIMCVAAAIVISAAYYFGRRKR